MNVALLTSLATLAFAGNSLLCRLALQQTAIDAATFTTIRLVAGALALEIILRLRPGARTSGGDWPSAVALFVYAAGFSWAYVNLSTATGALLLFGAVQITMIGWAMGKGERLRPLQILGLLAACAGLIVMLLPGVEAPPWGAALLMLIAGIAWGGYSLRGRGQGNPLASTTGNFWRASILAIAMSAVTKPWAAVDPAGFAYAVAGGALTSGVGYAIWYGVMEQVSRTTAATVQLTVPVLAAVGAVALLGESVTIRLALTSMVVLGGVALVVVARTR